jgi:hypothetical protein
MDPASAKQFLIARVVEEATVEHVSLSDVEKKMLHFTEVHPSLPDIYKVNAQFERDCDTDEYEAKISDLLKNARDRDNRASPTLEQQWKDSIDALKDEDHYILVLLYRAFLGDRKSLLPTHRVRDYIIYIAIGIALVFAAIGVAMWRG